MHFAIFPRFFVKRYMPAYISLAINKLFCAVDVVD